MNTPRNPRSQEPPASAWGWVPARYRRKRLAFTLVELVAAMAITAILMTAMGSAMILAGKAVPTGRSASEASIGLAQSLDEVVEDIGQAMYMPQRAAASMTLVVPDRTGDGKPEIILYSWSGTAGTALQRKINGGAFITVVPEVDSLTFTYTTVAQQIVVSTSGPITLTRQRVARVGLTIVISDPAAARLDTTIQTCNLPPIVTRYWDADFSSDPTQLDLDSDSVLDWSASSGSFNNPELVNGVWGPTTKSLHSKPDSNFTEPTTVDIRMRSLSSNGTGAVFVIYVDQGAFSHARLEATMKRESDGKQTLKIYDHSTELGKIDKLPGGFLNIRLVIVPSSNKLAVYINDTRRATYTYSTDSTISPNRYAKFDEEGSDAQFDRIRILTGGTVP